MTKPVEILTISSRQYVLTHLLSAVHVPATARSEPDTSPIDVSPGAGAAMLAVAPLS